MRRRRVRKEGRARSAAAAKERRSAAASKGNETAAMPDFVAPQLCTLVDRPPGNEGWCHEIKFDGYRVQLRVEDNEAALKTRKGLDWSDKFKAIAKAGSALPDALIDGEIVALDRNGAPDFSTLQAAISDGKTGNLIFFAFDLLFAGGEDLRALPLGERKERLEELLEARKGNSKLIRYVEHFEGGGDAILRSACKLSLEGIVSKKLGAPYRSGRSENWTKAKCRAGHEVVLGGWKTTHGKFRSLMAGVHCGDHLAFVGIVGAGFGQDTVRRIMPALKAAASDKNPFGGKDAPNKTRDVHWLKPELVAEIEFAGWTGDGNIRQAAFKGLRQDKPADEIEAEKPAMTGIAKPTARAAANPGKPKARSLAAEVRRGDGRGYLETRQGAVAGRGRWRSCDKARSRPLFRGGRRLDDRPSQGTAMLGGPRPRRHPWRDILSAPCDAGYVEPAGIGKVSGDRKPYLQIDRVEGLAAVAQIGGLELHPWNCAPDAPDVPGRLVFDLDPAPDVEFSEVIATARDMRQHLSELGLESFCKTTGGKGLHVVAPLAYGAKDRVTWQEAKAFALGVCRWMANENPERYLLNMSKMKRQGRIFLDYLRNDRMATAVAVLSPRARDGRATVSMPLTWAQLRGDLDPKRYTVRTVPALLAKTKAWQGYDDAASPIRAAMKKLAGK